MSAIGLRLAAMLGLVLGLSVGPAGSVAAQVLLVFAASSLGDALDAAIERYEQEGGGEVVVSYAASSVLARQIEQGAAADLYLTAHLDWLRHLRERDLVAAETPPDWLGNDLVLIAPAGTEVEPGLDLAERLSAGRLALGDPDHVPAGIYARAALEHLGIWEALAPAVVRADNVRVALALVARGDVPLGIVYRSDARAESGVQVVEVFPGGSHPTIRYAAAVLRPSRHPEALAFLRFLQSERALSTFARFGFRIPT